MDKFCTKCGTELINGVCPKCSQDVPQVNNNDKYKQFFMNPNENFVCALGNGYIQNFLANGSVGKGFAVVSDKRVYFKGEAYEVVGKKLRTTNQSKTVDLKDVTGTSVRTVKYLVLLILGIIGISYVALCFIFAIFESSHLSDIDIILFVISFYFFSAVIGGPFLICYFATRKTILTISYAGGCIAFNINWYPKEESDNFQKMLRIAKDKAVENMENATANAVREVIANVAPAPPTQAIQSQAPAIQTIQPQAPVMSADDFSKYAQLYKDGLITEEEFAAVKARLLNNT